MADNHYVSCIAASYISFTNRPVKTGCVKTKLSAISSLGLGWKILQIVQHSANPLLTGVPAEGFGHLIASARLRMFQPEKRASVPAIWTHTSKKQKYGFKKPRFFLSEGPESWYKFCRILHQVLWNLVPSSASRSHYFSQKIQYLLSEIVKKKYRKKT